MAETAYQYSVSDFSSGVDAGTLSDEIRSSGIVTALDRVDIISSDVFVVFKAALSDQDLTTLDGNATSIGGLIAAHQGTPVEISQNVNISNSFIDVHPLKAADTDGVGRAYAFSPSFTDKCTWWYKSLYVDHEIVATADGVEDTFSLANGYVIDLIHGKITEEELIAVPEQGISDEPTQWDPVVKVDGVVQQRVPAFQETTPSPTDGDDYYIAYDTGEIIFLAAPTNGAEITCSYFYSPLSPGSSFMEYKPPVGYQWLVDYAEVQFSEDVSMNDEVHFTVVVEHPLFGDIIAAPPSVYKTAGNLLDYSFGSHPLVPPFGGPIRGTQKSTIILRWEYISSITIKSSLLLKIRISLKDDVPFAGERATFTLYARETLETA